MANGGLRATGDVGVATIAVDPGVTQVGTSLKAAKNRMPRFLLIAGDEPMARRATTSRCLPSH